MKLPAPHSLSSSFSSTPPSEKHACEFPPALTGLQWRGSKYSHGWLCTSSQKGLGTSWPYMWLIQMLPHHGKNLTCSWTSCSISRLWGRGGRRLNPEKSVHPQASTISVSILNQKGEICQWICFWMSFSFLKSVLFLLLAQFNYFDLIQIGWSCHVWIQTTVPPDSRKDKSTKALPTFFFNLKYGIEQMNWNVTLVDCLSTHSWMSFSRLKWKLWALWMKLKLY